MMKNRYFRWTMEFLGITAISFVLKSPSVDQYWIVLPISLVFYSKWVEYMMTTTEAQTKVHAQLNFLYKSIGYSPDDNVRCTYHVPTWRHRLLQSTNYIPTGGGAGRSFPANKGIIGKAYQDKMSFVVNFANGGEYSLKMVSDYGYTADEVRQRTTDRRSYFCHPLVDENNKVLGLVYFDSSTPNRFPDTTSAEMRNLMIKLDLIRDSII